jgi:hypothetical protein
MKLRDYQKDLSKECLRKLQQLHICYLSGEVRTGKTLVALTIGLNYKSVLFVTKKKAISSILSDFEKIGYDYDLTVINYESLHKLEKKQYDLVICDESHTCGAFPKPSKRVKILKEIVSSDLLLMSGTPHPESWSQVFHQFFISKHSPFQKYKSFYKWAHDFVDIKQKKIGIYHVNDYSRGNKELIDTHVKKYFVTITQEEAGFSSSVKENFITVKMNPITYEIVKELKIKKVIEGASGVILADTPVKMMQKLHQIHSGTCKLEDNISVIIDDSKARAIKEKFSGKKIGIFYKFVQEKKMLMDVFGDLLCDNLEEFDNSDKSICLQIVSGREGISLRNAEYLVFLNIDFSATSYFQALDRMTTIYRANNEIFWVFSEGGIEHDIYKTVKKKKNFTLSVFNKL